MSEHTLTAIHMADHCALFGDDIKCSERLLEAGRRREHSTTRCWTLDFSGLPVS